MGLCLIFLVLPMPCVCLVDTRVLVKTGWLDSTFLPSFAPLVSQIKNEANHLEPIEWILTVFQLNPFNILPVYSNGPGSSFYWRFGEKTREVGEALCRDKELKG